MTEAYLRCSAFYCERPLAILQKSQTLASKTYPVIRQRQCDAIFKVSFLCTLFYDEWQGRVGVVALYARLNPYLPVWCQTVLPQRKRERVAMAPSFLRDIRKVMVAHSLAATAKRQRQNQRRGYFEP